MSDRLYDYLEITDLKDMLNKTVVSIKVLHIMK